ncbi:sensor histidine kinase [Longispora albida]|uniref:sensor histidine kinase n=1 Tax=Longispora albida TaxID=203523 RepID=UPI000370C704|nr:histidine kinase [Longispora albida]
MATNALRSLWAEPRPANAPDLGPRDWALVAVLICWSAVEAVFRQDLAPGPLQLLAVLAFLGPLLWRRTHPLAAVVISCGTLTIVEFVRILTGSQGAMVNSTLAVLILAYALFRWGSGREAACGLGVILLWLAIMTTRGADDVTPAEAVAGYAFFLFAGALGAAIRYRAKIRVRDIDQAKARERELLARELHDTVAHHVSGIAIQAQAGRAIVASHPERAAEALAVIEDAATRTLTELRAIVGVLRTQDTGFAPQPGVAEVGQLATDGRALPCVEVTLAGDFDDLSPAVGAAIYRLAQESITNARRHARHATQVTVAVTGDADQIRLTIDDDGSFAGGRAAPAGYGLVGMRERASLLGGTFHAGPAAERGWRVEAVLPRTGTPR